MDLPGAAPAKYNGYVPTSHVTRIPLPGSRDPPNDPRCGRSHKNRSWSVSLHGEFDQSRVRLFFQHLPSSIWVGGVPSPVPRYPLLDCMSHPTIMTRLLSCKKLLTALVGVGLFPHLAYGADASLQACTQTVKAKSGDTCASIAEANGISVTQFLFDNPTISSCSELVVGQDYCIAATGIVSPTSPNPSSSSAQPAPTSSPTPGLQVSKDGTCGNGFTCQGSDGLSTCLWHLPERFGERTAARHGAHKHNHNHPAALFVLASLIVSDGGIQHISGDADIRCRCDGKRNVVGHRDEYCTDDDHGRNNNNSSSDFDRDNYNYFHDYVQHDGHEHQRGRPHQRHRTDGDHHHHRHQRLPRPDDGHDDETQHRDEHRNHQRSVLAYQAGYHHHLAAPPQAATVTFTDSRVKFYFAWGSQRLTVARKNGISESEFLRLNPGISNDALNSILCTPGLLQLILSGLCQVSCAALWEGYYVCVGH
ncbi:hypothetical protein VTK73DRAFT_567 [Phialemonium thermophilum]|uniref:LysM domain-containing protein n=1 Tax=Phialemonium thermophilum TaxID=223376 RepID=A0ABR3XDI8_9PEZI